MVVANYDADNVGIFFGHGNESSSSQEILTKGFASQPYSVTVLDLNNDKLLDIIVVNYGTNNIGVLLGNGNGTFAGIRKFSTDYGSRPFFVVVNDFNNDNQLDFLVANEGTDSLTVLLQTC
jgi:hypothetical protein